MNFGILELLLPLFPFHGVFLAYSCLILCGVGPALHLAAMFVYCCLLVLLLCLSVEFCSYSIDCHPARCFPPNTTSVEATARQISLTNVPIWSLFLFSWTLAFPRKMFYSFMLRHTGFVASFSPKQCPKGTPKKGGHEIRGVAGY